ncbi:MAG: hypothetical protein ACE5HV_13340 [Acidobacteriota bacterium]
MGTSALTLLLTTALTILPALNAARMPCHHLLATAGTCCATLANDPATVVHAGPCHPVHALQASARGSSAGSLQAGHSELIQQGRHDSGSPAGTNDSPRCAGSGCHLLAQLSVTADCTHTADGGAVARRPTGLPKVPSFGLEHVPLLPSHS